VSRLNHALTRMSSRFFLVFWNAAHRHHEPHYLEGAGEAYRASTRKIRPERKTER
jgi:hypothetical protein